MLTLAINDWFRDLFFGGPEMSNYGPAGSDGLYMYIWWVGVFFFFLVVGLMLLFAWQYRRKPGVAAPRSASHNTALEITWTVIPTLIMAVIFFWGYQGYLERQVAPAGSELIELTAQKWAWTMTYDNGRATAETKEIGNIDAPIFYVPEDSPVLLRMHSTDVLHSFWVPDFRTKLDVIPNRYQPYWFHPEPLDLNDPEIGYLEDENGNATIPYRDHVVFCAEYCGDLHSEMAGVIRVVPAAYFTQWKNDPGYDWEEDPFDKIGEILYIAKGCNACHSIDGSANVGPTWLNAYNYEAPIQGGANIPANDTIAWDNYIRESILEPAAKIHEGYPNQMPSYQGRMTDDEISAIIAYMKTLSDRGGPASPPAGGEDADEEGVEDASEEASGDDADEGGA